MNSEICTKKYYVFNEVTAGIAIVKKYIQENSQILVGGQSIDYALRLKGVKLYEDWEIPDLDFQTDDYANVAYAVFAAVAKGLNSTGINVTVLNALHPTTMRVQVAKFSVADITFIPTRILEMYRESALTYDGCLIRHPFFQYLDIQRSFSYPYENPMMEVITHRWAKDFKRFLLTMQYYSPSDSTLVNEFFGKYNVKEKTNLGKLGHKKNRLGKRTMLRPTINTSSTDTQQFIKLYKSMDSTSLKKPLSLIGVINGELAYMIYRTIYKKLLGKTPPTTTYIEGEFYQGSEHFLNSYLMTLEDKEKFLAKNAKLMDSMRDTNPYLDVIPSRSVSSGFELVNVSHRTSYHDVNLSTICPNFPSVTVKIVSINFLILHISMLWITLRSTIYLSMFIKLLRMIEKVYKMDPPDTATRTVFRGLLFPSIKTYGPELAHPFEVSKLRFDKPANIFINKYNTLETALTKITKFEYPEIYNLDGL